jgi:THO complex subunit 2
VYPIVLHGLSDKLNSVDRSSHQEPGSKTNTVDKDVGDTQKTAVAPAPAGSTDMSSTEIKQEDSEKAKTLSVHPESTVEATAVPAAIQQEARISGSSTPSSIRMPTGEMRQPDDNSKLGTQRPRGVERPESASNILHPPPNLPDRPERPEARHTRPNDARIPNRPPAHAESARDFRDNRSHDRALTDRHGGNHQEGAQYPSPHSRPHERRSERVEPDPDRGERPRSQERDAGSRYPPQDRRNPPPLHENGAPLRESERSGRSRAPAEPHRNRMERERHQQEWPVQENAMAPPRGPHAAGAEAPNINPERAALISGGTSNPNGISIRGQGEERPARASRPTSPKRDFDARHASRQERPEDRDRPESSDRRPGDFDSRQKDRHDAPFGNGPRNHHSDRPNRAAEGFPRDIRHQAPQQYPPVDMNHGRLNQDDRVTSRHHEQSSDRSEPPTEVPSGPRGRNPPSTSRGRNAHPPQPQIVTQRSPSSNIQPSMGAPDRPAPTGPASRSHTRGQPFPEQQSNSAPGTPADVSGVHPDRLALVSPSADGPPQRLPSYPSKPSPVQTSPTSVPSGPRGNAPSGAPSGPAPTSRGPPSGPQGNGRNNRHPLAAVNNTLQQAGQGQSIRGRGGSRVSNGPSMPHSVASTSAPGQSQGPRSEVTIPSSQEQGRPDLFSSRGDQDMDGRRPPAQRRDNSAPERPPPTGRRADLMDEAMDSGRRSRRHSSSRNHSPEEEGASRRNDRGPTSHRDQESYRSERDGESRDHGRDRHGDSGRDRRGGGGGDGPDRPSRESSSRQPPLEHDQQLTPGTLPPQRRSSRRDVASAVDTPPSSSSSHIPPPPQGQGQGQQAPPPPPHDLDRARRRGYQSGPAPSRPGGGDERDHHHHQHQRAPDRDSRDREREREREREPRASGRDLRGLPPPPPPPPLADAGAGDLPPRKHPRAEEGGPYSGSGGGGGARGGNRMASESKRPRRGGG